MRSKLSRLEAMRIAREQRDEAVLLPVVQPLRRELSVRNNQLSHLQAELDVMAAVVTSEVRPHVMPEIVRMIAERLEQHIYDAMAKASGPVPEIITVPLSSRMVRFSRPDELTAQILDKAAETYRTQIRGRGVLKRSQTGDPVTFLQIVVPQVTVEVELFGAQPSKRRRA